MERRCCLLNIIGAHSLDSILLPSDLRLRLFCLILRPLCRPMPALAFACYAAVLLYIPYWETLKQATIYFDSTMDSNPFWRPIRTYVTLWFHEICWLFLFEICIWKLSCDIVKVWKVKFDFIFMLWILRANMQQCLQVSRSTCQQYYLGC